MNPVELTACRAPAKPPFMRGHETGRWLVKSSLPVLVAGSLALGGCITVEAPEEPIVIELNINIRQEVIYRLAEDAGNTIEENADIF